MAKEAGPLQPIAKMKPALMASKKAPVPFAFSVNKDDGEGVMWLLKKGKAKGALAKMKKEAKAAGMTLDTSKTRFGMAEVDKEEDARRVVFRVNKDAGGAMRPKLLPLIKKCGLGSCEFTTDESLEDEVFDESAPEEADDDEAGGAEAGGAGAEGAPGQQEVTAGAEQKAPDAKPDGGDAAAMGKRLTDLVKRMMAIMGTKPAGADAMKTAAVAAQTAIKANKLDEASASADTLERLLAAAEGQQGQQQGGSPKNGVGSPIFAKAREAWVRTRQQVENDLEKLHKELQATYKGHGVATDLEKVFRSKVEPMMGQLDDSLARKLDDVAKATDPAAHAKLVEEARGIIAKFQGYLGSEPLIAKLDDNPFVPLSIEKTLNASLSALSKAVA